MKKCSKCGQIKSLEDFHNQRMGKYGVNSKCKECIKECYAEYRKSNPDKIKLINKIYRENNAEKIRKAGIEFSKNNAGYGKAYYRKNVDKWKEYGREHKEIKSEYMEEYRKNNAEKIKEQQKVYRKNNAEHLKNYRQDNTNKIKGYYKNNAEKIKEYARKYGIEYYKNNPERSYKYCIEYRKNNPEKMKEFSKRAHKKRWLNPTFRLNSLISNSIKHSLRKVKNGKNGNHWENLVNFKLQDLVSHFEKQFRIGMSWNNYGKGGWEIDHIIPVSLWKFESFNDREFKQCWSLANLQPLWAKENQKKHNKIFNYKLEMAI